MRSLVLLLLCLLPVPLLAQSGPPDGLPAGLHHPDSLRAWVLRPPSADTGRLRRLVNRSLLLISTDLDSARSLARAAVALAWRRGQGRGLVGGLGILADGDYYAADYLVAQQHHELLLWAARRTNRPDRVGGAYMGLGLVARALDNHAGAEQYFVQAQQTYASIQPPNLNGELRVLANRAYNFLDVDSLDRARPLVRQAVALLRQLPQARGPAKYRLLLGMMQEKDQQPDSAAATFQLTVRLGRATHDLAPEAQALLHLAGLALRRPDYPLALRYAQQARQLFHQLGDPQEVDALRQQAVALVALRQPEAPRTLRRYLMQADSALRQQHLEDVVTAQARFDLAEQHGRIRVLEQQRRIAKLEAEQRTVRSRLLLGGLLGGGLLLGLALLSTYRRRQRRRETALRHQLAADLHDDVGALLSRIALQTDLLHEGLGTPAAHQTQLAEVADNSRLAVRQLNDVVWNLDADNDSVPNLLNRLRDYAHDVLVPTGRDVRFVADAAAGATLSLAAPVRRQLYLIYKEALHNILKYAPANATVTVTLRRHGPTLALDIVNSGPVLPFGAGRSSGHGLRNIETRAASLGGSATAGPLAEGGFAVRVQVPVG